MNLTTHDWAMFWATALPFNTDYDRIASECGQIQRLHLVCVYVADHREAMCDEKTNNAFLDNYRHLVDEHGYTAEKWVMPTDPLMLGAMGRFYKVSDYISKAL